MPQNKPKLGPYDVRCDLCYRRGEIKVFKSYKELEAHLKAHFMAAAPFRIIAVA